MRENPSGELNSVFDCSIGVRVTMRAATRSSYSGACHSRT
jgi:hypothetical protein